VSQVMEAAERLSRGWDALGYWKDFKCPMNIVVHRGTIRIFRSFLYGAGFAVAWRANKASVPVVMGGESGVFVTSTVRDDVRGSPWYGRLQPVALAPLPLDTGLDIYRLASAFTH
jgi:hypothetical protein